MAKLFTAPGAWHGSCYCLEIELGQRSNPRLLRALAALERCPELGQLVASRELEPEQQVAISPAQIVASKLALCAATLSNGERVPCVIHYYRADARESLARDSTGTDWLHLAVPLGGLGRVWPEVGSFPFVDRDHDDRAEDAWRERIETWFVGIAQNVYAQLRFRLAVVGHELETDARRWWQWQRDGLPDVRYNGFLMLEDGSLVWHPPTRRGGWVLCDPSASWADLLNDPGSRR